MIGGDYDLRFEQNLINPLLHCSDRECRCQVGSGPFAEIPRLLLARFKTQTCSVDEIPMLPIFQETQCLTILLDVPVEVAVDVVVVVAVVSFPTSFKLFN